MSGARERLKAKIESRGVDVLKVVQSATNTVISDLEHAVKLIADNTKIVKGFTHALNSSVLEKAVNGSIKGWDEEVIREKENFKELKTATVERIVKNCKVISGFDKFKAKCENTQVVDGKAEHLLNDTFNDSIAEQVYSFGEGIVIGNSSFAAADVSSSLKDKVNGLYNSSIKITGAMYLQELVKQSVEAEAHQYGVNSSEVIIRDIDIDFSGVDLSEGL